MTLDDPDAKVNSLLLAKAENNFTRENVEEICDVANLEGSFSSFNRYDPTFKVIIEDIFVYI